MELPSDKRPQNKTDLTIVQIQVITRLAGGDSITAAAGQTGIDRGTVHRWLSQDAAFVAELNRVKTDQLMTVRTELRQLASKAVATIRELLTDPTVAEGIRLKAAEMILSTVGGFDVEKVGPTDADKVRSNWAKAKFCEELEMLGIHNPISGTRRN